MVTMERTKTSYFLLSVQHVISDAICYNLFDSQSFSELDMSEEKHKGNKSNNKANTLQVNPNNSNKNHSEVTKPIPLATASPPVTVLNSQQQLKTKGLESATKLLTSNKNQPKRLQNEKTSIDIQQQHQHQNNNDNDETDKLFEDIKFNVISESNGFDLGSSLLDEVFKCFQMEKSIEKTNNTGNDEENQFDSNTKKETDRIYSINNNQHSDVLNGVGNDDMLNLNSTVINKLSSTDDLTTEYPVGTFNATPDPIKMGRNAWKPVDVSRQFRASSSSSTPRRILTNGSITPHSNDYLSTYITSNNKNNSHILDSPSHQSIFTNTLNYEVKENRVSDSNYVENHRVVGNDDDDDDSDVNHLRKLKSTIIKTEHKSSLWKRSSFGSLTRRSSSVSKSSNKNNFMGFNQSDHDNNTNKRLTISRPVLLSRPNSITQTSLNQLPSNSSSSSIVGGLTEPSSLGSSTSRGSSLTVVSSANGCSSNSGGGGGGNACSLSVNNGQEELLAPETHSLNTDIHHQPSASSYYEISTNASLSPAPSLSSMIVTNYLLPNSNVTSTAQGCLRALRSGETVFRASMNTSSGTLNSRRKMSMSSRVNPTVMADENLANSRIQNLSPSATLINLTAKNANDTSISSSSSSLLKNLTRTHLSQHSSSSSSSISPPTTPFPYDSSNGQPGNIHSKLDRTTLITSMAKTNGSNDNRSSMDLDCVMASFLGKDFADFLGGDTNIYEPYSSSSPSKHLSNKSQVGLDSQSNLSRSPFKSSLSRLPRRSNLPNNEEDDVLAI
ncbi:unnamed protein product [Heterobilharzia americana]|nr:unnamed protein product [Heterobilharzia americana]